MLATSPWLELSFLLTQRRKRRLRVEQELDLNTPGLCIFLGFFQSLGKLKLLPELGFGRPCKLEEALGSPSRHWVPGTVNNHG